MVECPNRPSQSLGPKFPLSHLGVDSLYSTPQLCELVGIADRTIRRWISRGWIDPERVELGDSHAYVWKPRDVALAKRLKLDKPIGRKRRFELALGVQ